MVGGRGGSAPPPPWSWDRFRSWKSEGGSWAVGGNKGGMMGKKLGWGSLPWSHCSPPPPVGHLCCGQHGLRFPPSPFQAAGSRDTPLSSLLGSGHGLVSCFTGEQKQMVQILHFLPPGAILFACKEGAPNPVSLGAAGSTNRRRLSPSSPCQVHLPRGFWAHQKLTFLLACVSRLLNQPVAPGLVIAALGGGFFCLQYRCVKMGFNCSSISQSPDSLCLNPDGTIAIT